MATSATLRSQLGAPYDQYIDPATLDYVDTDDGEWLETADTRTIMMIQLEVRLGTDITAPADGTRIKAMLETGDPVTPEVIVAESLSAAQVLVDAGDISDVSATMVDEAGRALLDDEGRPVVAMAWRDLQSGSPVDLRYAPFQGA